jgi:hypothetical protein
MNTVSNMCVFYANMHVTLNVHIHRRKREERTWRQVRRKMKIKSKKATVMTFSHRLSREKVWETRKKNNHMIAVIIIVMQTIGWNRWVDNQVFICNRRDIDTYTFFSRHAESLVRTDSFFFSSSSTCNYAREKIYL